MFAIKSGITKTDGNKNPHRNVVNQWLHDKLSGVLTAQLLNSTVLDVMEVECNEPDCAPIEVLVIIGFPDFAVDGYRVAPHKWAGKILKPLTEVTVDDVQDLKIPVCVFNTELLTINNSIDMVLSKTLNEEAVPKSLTLLRDLQELLQAKVEQIKMHLRDKTDNDTSAVDTKMDEDEVTPVFMSSTVNPATITGPSSFTKSSTSSISTAISGTTSLPSSKPSASTVTKAKDYIVVTDRNDMKSSNSRHEKGTRPRGCPCCDPDNLDNIIDKMLFMEMPPI